ncbi:unnamed protein product [Ambrosiozyma monospora]|uniref:Unnamed protein product n=1 Tax=Ambrosiozyma monospora TaxID=43982 RepID=A0ACB5UAG6_AMBMO|nr:unnamed protein product [Ambrosiozyma monospora]
MRIRKTVLFVFISSTILAAYLGFADISLPHDKWIHFTMFFVMSFLFYWILDSNSMRTIRNLTFIVCTLIGGIGSEFVQHIISPKRTFDVYDILANVCGSTLAVAGSNYYHSRMIKKTQKYKIRTTDIDIESYLSESSTTDLESNFDIDADEIELTNQDIFTVTSEPTQHLNEPSHHMKPSEPVVPEEQHKLVSETDKKQPQSGEDEDDKDEGK